MFEYNFTNEMEVSQLKQDVERLKADNLQYQKEIEELNDNIETLLNYNTNLLSVIEEINASKFQKNGQQDEHQNIQSYLNEIKNLRERIQQYEENEIKYKEQLKKVKMENGQKDKNPKEAGSGQVIKLVQECYKNNQAMQKKFQQRFDNLFKEIQDLRTTSKSINEQFNANFQDRRTKIEDIFDQFQKKDEIVELMGQKVKILQDYYVSRKAETQEKMIQTDQIIQPVSQDSRDSKKHNNREQIQQFQNKLEQKNKVIKIYEELINKLRKKVSQKYFS